MNRSVDTKCKTYTGDMKHNRFNTISINEDVEGWTNRS
jgi:hypothetical protein